MVSISIVIPTYNGEKYIEEAILSVLDQTVAPDEIIISDDNSTDDTLRICEKFNDKIKIFRNINGPSGFVNGWKIAISHASGEYISILHQDDKLAPNFIEEIRKAIYKFPDVKHFFSPCEYIDAKGDKIERNQDHITGKTYKYSGREYANAYERIKGRIHRCPGVVTHKSIFEVCNYRKEAGHIADDDFFLRVGNYTDVVGILKPLAFYREHSGSETGHLDFLSINKRLLESYHFQLKHYKENPLLSTEIVNLFKQWESEYIHRLIIFGIKLNKLEYVKIGFKYWLNFTKEDNFGNLKYDIRSMRKYIKDRIRLLRIKWLFNHNVRRGAILKENDTVLIVAPHPDDEVIGCGGLIAKLVKEGNIPYIIFMTGGENSHGGCCSISTEKIKEERRKLTREALSILGVPEDHIHELDFPDGKIPSPNNEQRTTNNERNTSHNERRETNDESNISQLKTILSTLHSPLSTLNIFVPHWGEGWPDHVNTSRIIREIAPKNAVIWEYCVWTWYYNIWRGIDWKNAFKLEMTPEEHEKKMRAMDAYVKPLAPCGKPWSGVLPEIFLKAHKGNSELYFKVR